MARLVEPLEIPAIRFQIAMRTHNSRAESPPEAVSHRGGAGRQDHSPTTSRFMVVVVSRRMPTMAFAPKVLACVTILSAAASEAAFNRWL